MINFLWCYLYAWMTFRDYKPQPITVGGVWKWYWQFTKRERKLLPRFLRQLTYLTEADTKDILLRLNEKLLEDLALQGVSIRNVIYVQIDDAGSSSPVMLNLLRDGALIEGAGCAFLDAKNVRGLHDATDIRGEGAIVYIDDFSGSGKQFQTNRNFVKEYIVGNFVEFFLAPVICEESAERLKEGGVEPRAFKIHAVRERALRAESDWNPAWRDRLVSASRRINDRYPLGFRNMGTMVAFYRNAPNSTPLLLRGNKGQSPAVGILPRTTDLKSPHN
jgi:hypothetical protein